jgi:pimeloyl-ACP methyl ester carboxylesterase
MAARTTTQAVQQVHGTPLDVLERQIAGGEVSDDLRALLGDTYAGELEAMVQRGAPAILSDSDRPIVILLPGITGSLLSSVAGDLGLIWLNPLSLVLGKLSLLMLDRRGAREATPGVRVVASGLLPTHYLLIQFHLRLLGGCEVLGFPFDWRRPPDAAVADLRRLVMTTFREKKRKVHIVGHSMGGLVARNFCLRHPRDAEQAVAQVIQLGSPNYGSFESVRNITVGGDSVNLVARVNPANIPIAVMRSCPGLYSMLPAPPELFPSNAPQPYPFTGSLKPYDPAAYGDADVNPRHLEATRAGYAWLAAAGELPTPCTIIAGYDLPTCTQVRVEGPADNPQYIFATSLEGDGTVPLASVTGLPGANRLYRRGLDHGNMPLDGAVRDAVRALVHGQRPLGFDATPQSTRMSAPPLLGAAIPGVLGEVELDTISSRVRADVANVEDLRLLSAL